MTKKVATEVHPKGTNEGKTVYQYGVAFSGKKVEVTVG